MYFRANTPSRKQFDYLSSLVQSNNDYRSRPLSVQWWISHYLRGRFTSDSVASLIGKLIHENHRCKTRLSELDSGTKSRQEWIHASDFSVFSFCEMAFELKVRGEISRNLYDLDRGHFFHSPECNKESKEHQISHEKYLKTHLMGFTHIAWADDSVKQMRDDRRRLIGKIDAVIHLGGQERILELKSTFEFSQKEPFVGHRNQLIAYLEMSGQTDGYLLYISTQGERSIFHVERSVYYSEWMRDFDNMRSIVHREREPLPSNAFQKCSACGYRSLCKFSLIEGPKTRH